MPSDMSDPSTPVTLGILRTELVELRTELRTEMGELRTELRTEMGELRTELRTEMGELRTDLRAEIKSSADEVRADLRAEIRAESSRLESCFDQKLDLWGGVLAEQIKQLAGGMRGMEDRLIAELARHVVANGEDQAKRIGAVDEKYADLPDCVGRLEDAVLGPGRRR